MVTQLNLVPACVNEVLRQFWDCIDRDLTSELNTFDFSLSHYLGDTIWCNPTPSLHACQYITDYIFAASKLALFTEAIVLLPTSVNRQFIVSAGEANELLFARQRLAGANTGYCLAYFSPCLEHRGQILSQIAKKHFWTA